MVKVAPFFDSQCSHLCLSDEYSTNTVCLGLYVQLLMKLVAVGRWSWWFAPWPFFILVLIYDELRKWVLRMYLGKSPTPGFVEQELYY